MEIYTIGFTKKSAGEFFEILKRAGIRRLVDVRLNNTSQLAAFTKREDLQYFLKEICQAEYLHLPILSPSKDILDAYRKGESPWEEFQAGFLEQLDQLQVERTVDRRLFDVPAVLLCSEATPEHCHRRLVAEYLSRKWGDVRIVHL